MIAIKEVIVVEGRDDIINLKQYVKAEMIATHGYGINRQTLERIRTASEKCGIIIFTDPDHAGERIRKRLAELFPDAKHAFISRDEAQRGDDIGVENASGEAVLQALSHVRTLVEQAKPVFTQIDLLREGLSGQSESAVRRDRLGKILGIGYANGKQLLNRLNGYGITREEFEAAMKEVNSHEG